MLYHLIDWLEGLGLNIPGTGLMHYLSFRAMLAAVISLLIAFFAGKKIIAWLQKKQIGETIRDLGLEGQMQKKGTPTMGGVIIIISLLGSALLICRLDSIYTLLLMLTTVWCGAIGFTDDYIKVFRHRKEGMSEKGKLVLQFGLGLVIALTVCVSPDIPTERLVTTIPFVKAHEFDYSWLSPFNGQLGVYIPGSGEVAVFMAAFVGALIGFLWYNTFPAMVFMGDTGSLTIGGIIGVGAVLIRKELLLPVLCGIFLMESLSVIIQRSWFKHTKRKYGEGRRVFLMAPLHHHYQKKGIPEPRIVTRFWIIGILLAIGTLALFKIR